MRRKSLRGQGIFFMPFLARFVTLALMMLIGSYGVAQAQTGMEEATKKETAARDFLGLEWGAGIGVMGSFGGGTAVEKASIIAVDDDTMIVHVEEEGDLRPQLFLEMHIFLGGPKIKGWRKYQREKAAAQMDEAQRNARKNQIANGRAGESQDSDETKEGQASESIGGEGQAPETTGEGQIPERVAGQDQGSEKRAEDGQAMKDKPRNWPNMPDPPQMGFGPFIALQSSDNSAIDALTLGLMWGFRKDPEATTGFNVGVGLSFDPSVQILAKGFNDGNPPPNGETAVRFTKESRFGWVLMTSFTF